MRTRFWARRPLALATALALAAILPACGGGSSGGGGNAPTTLPPAPVRTLLIQGNFSLASAADVVGAPADIWRHEFTTSGTGNLEVNADWTFATSQMAVGVLRGSCSFAQIIADACAEVVGTFPASKPARLNVSNLAAGTYTFVMVNVNNRAESGNYQVYLTR